MFKVSSMIEIFEKDLSFANLQKLREETNDGHDAKQNTDPVDLLPLRGHVADGKGLQIHTIQQNKGTGRQKQIISGEQWQPHPQDLAEQDSVDGVDGAVDGGAQ